METGGEEEYTRSVLDIRPGDDRAAQVFRNLITSPLPYSGSVASPLSELPKGYDCVRVLASPPQSFTTWNVQSHAILVAYGSVPHEARGEYRGPPRVIHPPQVLVGDALAAAMKMRKDLSGMQVEGLNTGKRWMTTKGEVIKRLDPKSKFRHAVLTGKALEIFKMCEEPRCTPIPSATVRTSVVPSAGPSSVHDIEDALDGFALADMCGSDMDLELPEPPPTGTPEVIPVRTVQPTLVSIQGTGPVTVPKTQAYTGLEAYINERGVSSQGLVPGTRSVLARDTPSIAYLVSYMDGSNATFIDTAPILRALLYVFPAHIDAWEVDKIDRQFIRDQVGNSRSALTVRVYDVEAPLRVHMELICATLPAFAEHLKGLDTLLGSPDPAISHGFNLGCLDSSWTVVPVDSYTLTQPWLLEYIVAFMSSSHWNGRLNWIWHANYQGPGAEIFRGHHTTIPAAHNVYIPGPDKVMLVLIEDSGYAHNRNIRLPGRAAAIPVYNGVRSGVPPANINNFLIDFTDVWHNTFTTQNYIQSAQRMLHALHYMEKNLSTNMAFASAVTLASELANVMPECPQIRLANQARTYTDLSYGMWTYGARDRHNRTPRMRTNDVNLGPEANRAERFATMVAAYSFGSLSPCLQYAASSTRTLTRDVYHQDRYLGRNVRWANQVPTDVQSQYTCHTSHSVYRLLRVLGYTIKNDYSYNLASLGGLQNTLVNNGVLLSLGLSLAMVTNDISLQVWSGLGSDQMVAAHMSSRNLVAAWTGKMILQRHPNAYFHGTTIRAGTTVDDAFEMYYGRDSVDAEWATHIPLPVYVLAQWAEKCNIALGREFSTQYGRVAEGLTARYSVFKFGNHIMLPLAAGTADVLTTAPASYQQRMTVGTVALPMVCEDWAEMTSGTFPVDTQRNRYQSNILSVSMRYHYQDTSNDCQVAIVNDYLASRLSFATIMSVDRLLYPDPPNLEVFRLTSEVGAAATPQDKDQEAAPTKITVVEKVKPPPVTKVDQTTGPVQQVATGPKLDVTTTLSVPPVPEAQPNIPVVGPAQAPSQSTT